MDKSFIFRLTKFLKGFLSRIESTAKTLEPTNLDSEHDLDELIDDIGELQGLLNLVLKAEEDDNTAPEDIVNILKSSFPVLERSVTIEQAD